MSLPKKLGRGSRLERRTRRARPGFEALEGRDLKTVTVALVPSMGWDLPPEIVITGDDEANHVTVSIDNRGTPGDVLDDKIKIVASPPSSGGIPVAAQFFSFPQYSGYGHHHDPNTSFYEDGPIEAYSLVRFEGHGGDDRFENNANMRCAGDGGAGDDYFSGGPFLDHLDGGGDNDIIHGGGDQDHIHGGPGNDRLYGDGGDDVVGVGDFIFGDEGDDHVYGSAQPDQIHGGPGNDHLHGGGGDDYVFGEGGHDTIYLGAGSDHGYGGEGHDLIHAGSGADGSVDYVDGGPGINTLYVKKKDKFQYGWFVYLIS